MQRKAFWLWAGFGFLVCLALVVFSALLWLIFGPLGPPAPWEHTPVAETAAPATTVPTAQVTAVPTTTPSPGQTPLPTIPPPPTATPRPTLPPPLPTTTPPPTTSPLPTATLTPYPEANPGTDTARRLAETNLPPRDLVAIAGRLQYGGNTPPRTAPPDPQPYTIGRRDRFWVSDPALDRQREITATLRFITDHLYMYVEEGISVDEQALEQAALFFEQKIYPTNHQAFGSEWSPGVDSDPHLVILNASFEGAAGYFSSLDEVPREVNPFSNQHEMFYMNVDAFQIGSNAYLSTLAHEFQHMIHWYQDPRGDAWVDEGMAQMAEQLNGYDASDLAWAFLYEPDLQLTTWTDLPEENLAHYAASYLWFRYFTHHMGGPEVMRDLLDPAIDDVPAIERVLEAADYRPAVSAPSHFDAFFADWAVANYLNNPTVGDGRYAYDDNLQIDTVWASEWVYTLPWETSSTVDPYGTDYIEVESYDEGSLEITFDGVETLPLMDTTPYSGNYFWWSNRGDLADSHLTRAFDLSSVDRATLRCRLWYDIEDDYDYAYIEVSTDGGNSWEILAGQHTTTSNPNGNNLGYGYTGPSGGKEYPQWIQEEIDLSAYTGREVQLRFEMITDDALNTPGLALDDVEIPEIGFHDDMESGTGWESAGFVWVDNVVPVHFLVQVIAVDKQGEITVQALPLNGKQRGELLLSGYGRHLSKVTLAISAVAPATTEPAAYDIQLKIR